MGAAVNQHRQLSRGVNGQVSLLLGLAAGVDAPGLASGGSWWAMVSWKLSASPVTDPTP
jgi:hypothetical protein